MKKAMFLSQFLIHSRQVGSVAPSSGFLARKMLPATTPWHKMHQIAELGPGTGVFTAYLEQYRGPQSTLYLFEKNETFRSTLQMRFPQLPIVDDALRLVEIVQATGRPFDLIVSGLPFANFPSELQERLFRTIHQALAPRGVFVAFQYSLLLKRKFAQHFRTLDIGYTWMNVPPAWVFKCVRLEQKSAWEPRS
ncbi:class I SAM-dependent methyltransferase [Paenibacillus elgii]|uniref:class I SAM-dependent methyltransferase n=1 Tax=Paenibacillus elgii TaxID=189691 RepID=UPI002041B623|nr:methyltransferase domain-containing protein [Paenibacillus elgii]MCM3271242.1 methyltransferase domain-containing protein [Paenibacillus elgii]